MDREFLINNAGAVLRASQEFGYTPCDVKAHPRKHGLWNPDYDPDAEYVVRDGTWHILNTTRR